MKTWTERLEGIIAFIESGNGIAKAKAKKELKEMAVEIDKLSGRSELKNKICCVCGKEVKITDFGFALCNICKDNKNS